MENMNHKDFMKKVFNKGIFKQFTISPYSSTESFNQKVVLFSDNVEEPTWYSHRRSVLALILPLDVNVETALIDNAQLIKQYTGVVATYYGLFEMNGKQVMELSL